MVPYTQSGKSVQRLFENKSQWDAAHSGSHRSQCKIMQISMGRIPAILWRYPGDTLKWKKGTPRHQSPSSFQHNHISKFQKGKTQHNPIPNGTDTLGKFRTYKNAGKNINVPNHVFQNTSWTQHAPTSRNLSPQLNATKQVNALSFQMGCSITPIIAPQPSSINVIPIFIDGFSTVC